MKTEAETYYAVIFTSRLSPQIDGYNQMALKMEKLASEQPGYLGFESARQELGISVSYWKDLESIKKWKDQLQHVHAQKAGKEQWYDQYHIRICKVEREYQFIRVTSKQ